MFCETHAHPPPTQTTPPTSPPTHARCQGRVGVLNAGNFGVAQSRKRTFIWAAAPGEALPDWPRLMHCFRSPQLAINLPGGVQYTAVPQTVSAAGSAGGGRGCRLAFACGGMRARAGATAPLRVPPLLAHPLSPRLLQLVLPPTPPPHPPTHRWERRCAL